MGTVKNIGKKSNNRSNNSNHSIIRVVLQSFDHRLLEASVASIMKYIKRTGVSISGPVPLPSHKRKWTVLKAPTRFKEARDQYQIVVYKRLIDILSPNAKTISTLNRDVSVPPGVELFMYQLG